MQEMPSSLCACQYSIYLRSSLKSTSSRNLALLQTDGSYIFLLNILIIVSAHFLSFFFSLATRWKQSHHFADKGPSSQSYGFPSSHVRMWQLDHKEGWVLKNWRLWIMLEKTLESPLDCKIKPVNPKGNQQWIFTGRTDAEALILWSSDVNSWLTGKDSDAGKDWGPKKKRAAEDEMVGCHHWLNGYEFEQTPGDSEGQGSLECYNPHQCKVGHNLVTEEQHVGT